MKNIKETISKIQILREWNWCVNKERFISYAKAKCPLNNREADSLWMVWDYIITLNWYKLQDVSDEKVDLAVSIARESYEAVSKSAHISWSGNTPKSPKWKVYYHYLQGGEIQQMNINLMESDDVIKYALLLQQEDIEIRCRLDFHETVETSYGTDRIKVDIYDGDIIFCTDSDRWSLPDNSGAYLCTGGCYKRLMYTPGRGYIRRGEPDFEQGENGKDCRYYSYVFNSFGRKFKVVGNIYVDNSVLTERKDERE